MGISKVKQQKKTAIKSMEADLKKKGFRKLDPKLIDHNPPNIKWGDIFEGVKREKNKSTDEKDYFWDDKDRIEYLKKLARTMNHAASLIQDERNDLLKLLGLKEKQLEKMDKTLEANTEMVHSELEKINEERRMFNAQSKPLKGGELKEYLNSVAT